MNSDRNNGFVTSQARRRTPPIISSGYVALTVVAAAATLVWIVSALLLHLVGRADLARMATVLIVPLVLLLLWIRAKWGTRHRS